VRRAGSTLLELPGNHLTPCGADMAWPGQGQSEFIDMIGSAVRTATQKELRGAADYIVQFLLGAELGKKDTMAWI
jgi:hypothetical protein